MLIEVKVKVARKIDDKVRKRMETYLADHLVFADAEYHVMSALTTEQEDGVVENFDIQSLRISLIKEICTQFTGNYSFIATLKDIWLDDDGNEKTLKYKVLLWANSLTEANAHTLQLVKQGYDMQIEGIKQVDYEYLVPMSDGQTEK